MSRVAYLILSHRNPKQVVRLASVLAWGGRDSHVFIDHDASKSRLDPAALAGLPNTTLLAGTRPGTWGGISLIHKVLDGVAAIERRYDYDWVVFISGQDYPVQPVARIEEFLAATPYDGFVEGVSLLGAARCGEGAAGRNHNYAPGQPTCEKLPNGACAACAARYLYPNPLYYERVPLKVRHAAYVALKQVARLHQAVGFQPLPALYRPVGQVLRGGFWFTLSRRALTRVQEFTRANPAFVRLYRYLFVAEEAYFQTVLAAFPELKLKNDHLRFVNWRDRTRGNPGIFRSRDFDDLITSGAHFARKFDLDQDRAVFDMLDEQIGAARAVR